GERQVECVAGAESPTQGGTLGSQAEDVGPPAALCVCLSQAHGELVEHRIAHDRAVEVVQGSIGVHFTIGRKRVSAEPCARGRGLQGLLVVDLHALPHFGEQAVLVQVVAHEQVHFRGGAACGSTQGGFGQAFVTDNGAKQVRLLVRTPVAWVWVRISSVAARNFSGDWAAKASASRGTPSISACCSEIRRAVPMPSMSAGMLCAMARRKRPRACGETSKPVTAPAPADSPATVMLSGSPPKATMLSRTQRSAAAWSSRPRFSGRPGTCPKPSNPSLWLILTTTSPVSARRVPS